MWCFRVRGSSGPITFSTTPDADIENIVLSVLSQERRKLAAAESGHMALVSDDIHILRTQQRDLWPKFEALLAEFAMSEIEL